MKMINLNINYKKNLLAFSGGVDSTALFFILVENNIPFDIAIVDYNQREQSKDEVIYATQLAQKYNKKCYISTYPQNLKFSEKTARDYRHNFFKQIILDNSYESLITAHQLNDKLEWFLMQFTKGAGIVELVDGMKKSYFQDYWILKPLLDYSKNDLIEYLKEHKIKYFIDNTNKDQKYKRNYFRHNFSDKLIDKYQDGIKNSFDYLQNDVDSLLDGIEVKKVKQYSKYIFNADMQIAIKIIDKELKQRGVLITKKTRDEIIEKKQIVISHKIAIGIENNQIHIAPYLTNIKMDKAFKEKCRIAKIPSNVRAYLYSIELDLL
jgi:tRNA(Ile)-lysidine synthase